MEPRIFCKWLTMSYLSASEHRSYQRKVAESCALSPGMG